MIMTQKERKLKQAEEDLKNLLELRKETKDGDVFTRLSRTISLKRLEIKRLTG
jgi:hypothetical protein